MVDWWYALLILGAVLIVALLVALGIEVISAILSLVVKLFPLIADAIDYLGLGAVPVLGDLLDAAVFLYLLYKYRSPASAISLAELIPAVDFLPLHVVSWVASYATRRKAE